ncbi:Protein CBG03808 [Caenorhabditis briggsae]|uniref:Protein CBG03808 n=1 Tax=Caenorhabditis briggsae TaxID=6238 RepID=A8WWS7_CAEBR|nr:Protein CBG03808 [Caenorhabditis briggsae]CAP24636.2 Protein CBG03808 [Caenorhabditis briggsae]
MQCIILVSAIFVLVFGIPVPSPTRDVWVGPNCHMCEMRSLLVLFPILVALVWCQKIPNFTVSNAELLALAKKLRQVDVHRARPDQIMLNYQKHTVTRDDSDSAPAKLFSRVDSSLLRKPSYELYLNLMDNFNRQTGRKLRLENSWIMSWRQNQCKSCTIGSKLKVRHHNNYFERTNLLGHPIATSPQNFRFWIGQLWFSHYSRALGRPDTSGFEHVFIGEAKNGEISGLHNWLRFYVLENNRTENFDYKGFTVKRFNIMGALKFTWDGLLKRVGSILIGTTPEYDMALYTMCFLSRRGRETCDVELDGCPLQITSFEIMQQNKVYIGSIYPTAGRLTDECRAQNR